MGALTGMWSHGRKRQDKNTPQKINGWNLKITQLKSGTSSSKPSVSGDMLVSSHRSSVNPINPKEKPKRFPSFLGFSFPSFSFQPDLLLRNATSQHHPCQHLQSMTSRTNKDIHRTSFSGLVHQSRNLPKQKNIIHIMYIYTHTYTSIYIYIIYTYVYITMRYH